MSEVREQIVKTNRKEKFWFHHIRGINYFCYRYWWLVLLGFLIYLFFWYRLCYSKPNFVCNGGQTFNEQLQVISNHLDSCCACKPKIPERPSCPDRLLVFQVCNSNSARDDNFDIYLNGNKIGNLELNTNDQVGSVFIASKNRNVSITKPDFICPMSKMKIYFFDPSLLTYGKNIIEMKNVQSNNNGNRGDIEVRNYLLQGDFLISPCKVKNLAYEGDTGENFKIEFDYTKCCE